MQEEVSFEVYDFRPKAVNGEVVLYYKGAFSQTVLAHISQKIRTRYQSSPKMLSKLNSVFIELAQNIAYHSYESNLLEGSLYDKGVGTVMLQESNESIRLTTANIVKNRDAKTVVERCTQINNLEYNELRDLKKQLRMAPLGNREKKGGNIGLVQVAIKSRTTLDVDIDKLGDDQAFLVVSTSIEKQ